MGCALRTQIDYDRNETDIITYYPATINHCGTLASNATLENVKMIDTKTKDLVSGYAKQSQLDLPSDNVYFTIPTLVIYWILLYYYPSDKFYKYQKNYALSSNELIIKKREFGDGSAYLSKIVNQGVHRWIFRINKVNRSGSSMTIAIWKTKYIENIDRCLYDAANGKSYGWMITGLYLTSAGRYGIDKPKDGDIIEMIIDLNKRTLRYFCNGIDLGDAYQDIDKTTYRAAISMYNRDDCIELIAYQCLG